jgi:Flp pilus assembly protein TadG
LRREEGNATIEFVIFFPFFMMLFLSAFELGFYLFRSTLLERAVDVNVRTLRLGALVPTTSNELKRRICDDAMVIGDCFSAVSVELAPVSTTSWSLPSSSVDCVDRVNNIDPVLEFSPGGDNELMLVRVCAVVDPFFSSTTWVMDLPKDESGGYQLTAMSTFVNEP